MTTLIQQMTADFACSNLEILGTENVYFLSDAIAAPFKALVPQWIGSNFGYKFPLWLVASGLLTFFIVGLQFLPVGWWNALGGNTANPGWCIGFGFILYYLFAAVLLYPLSRPQGCQQVKSEVGRQFNPNVGERLPSQMQALQDRQTEIVPQELLRRKPKPQFVN